MNLPRILLAEDDPAGIELTLRAFQEFSLANQVAVVRDGEEALDYLYRRNAYADRVDGLPAVVLLDLKMPKLGGLDVLRHLRADPAMTLLPVVILTSSREESDWVNSYKLGASGYVVKPVDFKEFLFAVKHLGVFWALLNEAPPGCIPRPRGGKLAL